MTTEIVIQDGQYTIVQNGDDSDEESIWSYLASSLGVGDNPMREAEYIAKLIRMGYTQEEIAKRLRKDQSLVSKRNKLNNLLDEFKALVQSKAMSATAGYILGGLSQELQVDYLDFDKITIKDAEALKKKKKGLYSAEIELEQPAVIPSEFGLLPNLFVPGETVQEIIEEGQKTLQWGDKEICITIKIL